MAETSPQIELVNCPVLIDVTIGRECGAPAEVIRRRLVVRDKPPETVETIDTECLLYNSHKARRPAASLVVIACIDPTESFAAQDQGQ